MKRRYLIFYYPDTDTIYLVPIHNSKWLAMDGVASEYTDLLNAQYKRYQTPAVCLGEL